MLEADFGISLEDLMEHAVDKEEAEKAMKVAGESSGGADGEERKADEA